MTKDRAAWLKENDPTYFERTGTMGAESLRRKHPDLKTYFSHLGKVSQMKKKMQKGQFDGLCSICEGSCSHFDNRIECNHCGWKIYSF